MEKPQTTPGFVSTKKPDFASAMTHKSTLRSYTTTTKFDRSHNIHPSVSTDKNVTPR